MQSIPTLHRLVASPRRCGLREVLMYISEQDHKISQVFYRLAFESLLKEMPDAPVFVIVVKYIGRRDALHHVSDRFIKFLDPQMQMTAHQAISIYVASPFCHLWLTSNATQTLQDADKIQIVISTLEYLLFVYSSKYNMIYVNGRSFSCNSWAWDYVIFVRQRYFSFPTSPNVV